MTIRSAKTSTRFRSCLRWACAASFSLLAACGDKKPELGPGDVRSLRVLAVQSEPADPVPGRPAVLRAIVLHPAAERVGLVWAAVDPASVLPGEGAPRAGFDASALGFAGLVTPPAVIPEDANPGFPFSATAAYVPAVSAPAGVTSVAVVLLARAGDIDLARALDPARQRAYLAQLVAEAVPAVKILRLNDAPANANPRFVGMAPLNAARWVVRPGATLEMQAFVDDESPLCESDERKDYGKRGTSCVSFSWYATAGRLGGFVRSIEPWEAPAAPGVYTLVVVARDRIGGLAWYLQDVNVGRPVPPGLAGRVLLRSVNAEAGTTPATRLWWLAVDDEALYAALAAQGERPFTAALAVVPDRSARLGLRIDAERFRIVDDFRGTSLQAAAERRDAGDVNVRFTVELLEPAGAE